LHHNHITLPHNFVTHYEYFNTWASLTTIRFFVKFSKKIQIFCNNVKSSKTLVTKCQKIRKTLQFAKNSLSLSLWMFPSFLHIQQVYKIVKNHQINLILILLLQFTCLYWHSKNGTKCNWSSTNMKCTICEGMDQCWAMLISLWKLIGSNSAWCCENLIGFLI
jgi:hypothetical protein